MLRHFAALLLLSLAAAFAQPASAVLFSVDLASSGDGLVTRDSDTGLDWLDVPLTTNLSYDQILGGAGGWVAGGWRYATQAELCHLWVEHAGAPTCSFSGPFFSPLPSAAQVMMAQLGITETVVGSLLTKRVNGLYDDATAPATSVGFSRIETRTLMGPPGFYDLFTSADDDAAASSSAAPTQGSFLVRASTPVPALPLAGTVALAGLLVIAARQLRTRGVR